MFEGKMLLELGGISSDGLPGSYELVVPYTATYHFSKPRTARLNDKF